MLLSIKRLVIGAFIHALLAWGALALSYSSYKRYMQVSLSPELKIAIKQTFPLSIFVFMALYVLYDIYDISRDKDDLYPTAKHYAVNIILYAVIINYTFSSGGAGVLIVMNLSIVYLIALLVLWYKLKRIDLMDSRIIVTPFARKYLQRSAPIAAEDLKAILLSHKIIVFFPVLLMLCALLLLFGLENGAKSLAHIAYFLLLIGVVTGMLRLIWSGETDGEE